MRISSKLAVVTLPMALITLLSGCVPPNPVVTPVPDPTAHPVFASEDEALAAAEEAYLEYLLVSDRVATTGTGSEELFKLATGDALVDEKDFAAEIASLGWVANGHTAVSTMLLQSLFEDAEQSVEIRGYVCLDLSSIDYYDANGVLVTADRKDSFALEIAFVNDAPGSRRLLLSESVPWTGDGVC